MSLSWITRQFGARAHTKKAESFEVTTLPIVLPPKRIAEVTRYLSGVAIVKNEAANLKEWLEFHRLVGLEHVYLYDDGSSDNSGEILRPYVDGGFVTHVPWAQFDRAVSRQSSAYAHALCAFGPIWRWMALIDLDEFLFPAKHENLPTALADYEDLPAIAVPWLMYGFCGHERRPLGLVTENYTRRAPFPPRSRKLLKWKCIVDPFQVEAVRGPHFFFLARRTQGAFTEKRQWISKEHPPEKDGLTCEVFRLNHYFTKSAEEFAKKVSVPSFRPRQSSVARRERMEKLSALIEAELVLDQAIQRYLPELRRACNAPHFRADRSPVSSNADAS